MSDVVLRPFGHARYAVSRGGVDTGVQVHRVWDGWQVDAPGGRVVLHSSRLTEARWWLDGPDGRAFLESLVTG